MCGLEMSKVLMNRLGVSSQVGTSLVHLWYPSLVSFLHWIMENIFIEPTYGLSGTNERDTQTCEYVLVTGGTGTREQ
jgi:hypothetical protein